eukprot:3108263-Prymnesium_polylepis.1
MPMVAPRMEPGSAYDISWLIQRFDHHRGSGTLAILARPERLVWRVAQRLVGRVDAAAGAAGAAYGVAGVWHVGVACGTWVWRVARGCGVWRVGVACGTWVWRVARGARECVARECVARECVARGCVARGCVARGCGVWHTGAVLLLPLLEAVALQALLELPVLLLVLLRVVAQVLADILLLGFRQQRGRSRPPQQLVEALVFLVAEWSAVRRPQVVAVLHLVAPVRDRRRHKPATVGGGGDGGVARWRGGGVRCGRCGEM